jgi:transposase
MNNKQELRLKATRYYLNKNISLRKAALEFHIAYCTLFKWVKLYKEQGEEGLLCTYKRPWNRTKPDLEKRIVMMKEREPGLTVRKAKERLGKEGIKISIKGVWGIWKRYGYAGFRHKNASGSFTDYSWSKEAKNKYELANRFFNRGATEKSAEILNSIPVLPESELLPQLPDSLLNIRRRVEKIELIFGKIPIHSYLKKLKDLYEECYGHNLFYSALSVGLLKTIALSWSGEPLKILEEVKKLKNIIKKYKNHSSYSLFAQRLVLSISEGIAYSKILKVKKASDIARTCRILLKRRKHVSPFFLRSLGQLYAYLNEYREAKYWYLKVVDKLKGDGKKMTKSFLVDVFVTMGEYKRAADTWKNEELDHWASSSKMFRIQSAWAITRGMPNRTILLAREALDSLNKEELKANMHGCYFTIASAYCSLGEKIRARHTLKKILPFLSKNHIEDRKIITQILLSQSEGNSNIIVSYGNSLPTVKLALLLKEGKYNRALKYAEKKGLLGLLHRYVLFFPESIISLLERGKPTGLPRAMLNLPIFRNEIPVYSVKFLGNLIVYKNQKYLRMNLRPKDTSFLIYIANAKQKNISLEKIYRNFWPNSKSPSRNLAHLLVRLRKTLRLPSHLLYIKSNRLYFDCYFSTDYEKYKEHLTQAKAFLRVGEWQFAKKEYLHAFKLFRDKPFKKMYDNWSDDKRLEILFSYDTELTIFIRKLLKRGRKEEAERLLKDSKKIDPHLDLTLPCH